MNLRPYLFKHLPLLFITLLPLRVLAQKKAMAPIESVIRQLSTAKEDTNKVFILFNLAGQYWRGYFPVKNEGSIISYYKQGGELSRKLHFNKGIALSYIYIGRYYLYGKKDYAAARIYLEKGIAICFGFKDYPDAYQAARYNAAAMVFQNKAPENITYLIAIAKRLKKANQIASLAGDYFLIGDYSKYFSNYNTTMDYYEKALDLEQTTHQQYLKSDEIISIASFYTSLNGFNNLRKAKTLLLRAVAMDEKNRDQFALTDTYMELAGYAKAMHNNAAVLAYYDKALHAAKKSKDDDALSRTENEISQYYFTRKDYDRAYTHAKSALSYIGARPLALAYARATIGSIYTEAPDSVIVKAGLKPGRQYEKAAELLTGAIETGKADVSYDLSSPSLKELSLAYEKMHRYDDAYRAYKTYITQRDSTDSVKNEKAVLLKEAQLNYSKKEDSLKYAQGITSAELRQKKLESYFFIGGIIALVVLSAFISLNYRNQRKSNTLLTAANEHVTSANIELSKQREEMTIQRDQLANTVSHLKATQQQLIQAEKMASLGELTAGIAHEIQNPLNFVNNFSDVSVELIDEMQLELAQGDKDEAIAISEDIRQNLEKIRDHGKRADGIVKGMLEHSRASAGQKGPTDINKLADEYLRLAYHGFRAKDKGFNAELVTHFQESLPLVNVVPQDIGRVLLNLFNNAFYAVKHNDQPRVTVTTAMENGQLFMRVKDNGMGIPEAIRDKIMQPFFTTKPTGQGTGLGLSLSYDIIVKGHGGDMTVNSMPGAGAEFMIQLPTALS